jgi:hypothetical protein
MALLALFASSPAGAFCRTTVCRDSPCPLDEGGCPTLGKPAVWAQRMPLTFRFQARGTALLVNEEARAAVRAAFFRWTDVICDAGRTSLRFVEEEDLAEDKPLTEDGRATGSVSPFGIFFRDAGWPHKSQNGDGMLALTTLAAGVETGRITYADIEINTGGQPLAATELDQGIDLQTVVTHEVGHYIGLAHSSATNSIMNANLCENAQRCQSDKVASRRLGNDDRAAVCALYPPGATPPAVAPGPPADAGGCASSGPPRVGGAEGWAVALALAGILRVRSSRRGPATGRPRSSSRSVDQVCAVRHEP